MATPGGRLRREGFEEEMGSALDPSLVVEAAFDPRAGYEAAIKLLSRPEPPDAIFAASDSIALGVLYAADELGLDVPGDIGVAGFDGSAQESALHGRKLTTMAQSWGEISREVVDLLLEVIETSSAAPVSMDAELVVGSTT